MQLKAVSFPSGEESVKAYEAGRCDSFTTDSSGLYAERLKMAVVTDHIILPEIISKEPLAPAVRHGDDQWLDIVKWVHYAMVTAEELGVTKANVDERLIKHLGNYGESFERNVGSGSRLQIARGVNDLWNKGGLMYAPPIR
jgi:general L-amino acid transport system substrate-binding protein